MSDRNLVFFLGSDSVAYHLIPEILKHFTKQAHFVLFEPDGRLSACLEDEGAGAQILYRTGIRPDWKAIGKLLGELEVFRGFSWFPFIFPDSVIECCSHGIVNLHNAYLPFNRGRHSTFWAIVEEKPLGASLHWVSSGIDSGAIIDQRKIAPSLRTNADIAYEMQLRACLALAAGFLPRLLDDVIPSSVQDESEATHHFAKEIAPATTFDSEDSVTWSRVLKLIRGTATSKGAISIVFDDGRCVRFRGYVIDDE